MAFYNDNAPWDSLPALLSQLPCYSGESKRRIQQEVTALLKEMISLVPKMATLGGFER